MRSLFGSGSSEQNRSPGGPRVARHSSGWAQLRSVLRDREALRILDIGPTSSSNINYITGLGHSIYMANLVQEAARPEWMRTAVGEVEARFDVEGFLAANLDFSGRPFDVITFWDTADYLPAELLPHVLRRLHEVMEPGGKLLAFFHSKATGADTAFTRYHLTETDAVEMQGGGNYPLLQVYSNREIERQFSAFGSYRFFLAKDSLREVIVTR